MLAAELALRPHPLREGAGRQQQHLRRVQLPAAAMHGVVVVRQDERRVHRPRQPRAEAGISAGWRALAERADEILGIVTPTLVLAGGLDTITPPSGGRQLAQTLPNAEFVVLDGVGHFPWVDDPEQFSAAVEAFLGAA